MSSTPAAHGQVRAAPVLYFDGMLTPTNSFRGDATGSWELHLVPDDGGRRRLGLLVRGHRRCWVDLPAHRFR